MKRKKSTLSDCRNSLNFYMANMSLLRNFLLFVFVFVLCDKKAHPLETNFAYLPPKCLTGYTPCHSQLSVAPSNKNAFFKMYFSIYMYKRCFIILFKCDIIT